MHDACMMREILRQSQKTVAGFGKTIFEVCERVQLYREIMEINLEGYI